MKKHRLLASVLSVMLAASAAMTCYASTENYNDGEAHIVNGDVVNTDDSQTAVSADGSGTSVNVNGGVESAGTGVSATGGGAVTVGESVETEYSAVVASGNSSVSIGGDVVSPASAVNVSGNSTATIGGSVNNTGTSGGGISAVGGSTVNVTNDVTAEGDAAIYADNSTVTVGGSMEASTNGVLAYQDSNVSIGESVTAGPNTVYSGSTLTVGGDLNNTGSIHAVDAKDSTVNVTGSVTSQNGSGIVAGNGSTVTVGNDVKTALTAVNASGNSTITIGGNVENTQAGADATVSASDGSSVTISGNVTFNNFGGIIADSKSTVTVAGNVAGSSQVGALDATSGSVIILGGNVTDTNDVAISLNGDSKIIVEGDASGATNGIDIFESQGSSNGTVVVLGTVTAGDKDDSYCINVKSDALTQDEVMEALPTIIVGELSSANEQFVNYTDVSGNSTLDTEAVAQAIAEQILYYIEVQETENGSIKIDSGTTKVEGYDVAHANDTVTVTVTADQGYEIQTVNGGKATAVKNADGSWSITVPKTGGVSISAIMAAIKKVEDDTSDNNNSDSGNGSSNTNKKYSSDSDGSSGSSSSSSSSSGSSQSSIPETEGTWKQDADGNWYMQTPSGATYKNIWLRSDGNWYYAGPNGIITKGWLQIGNYWYYFANNGKMLTGWVEIDGKKYHLNDSLASLPIGAWIEE